MIIKRLNREKDDKWIKKTNWHDAVSVFGIPRSIPLENLNKFEREDPKKFELERPIERREKVKK